MFETVLEMWGLAESVVKDFIPEGYIEGANAHVKGLDLIFVSSSSAFVVCLQLPTFLIQDTHLHPL